MRLTIATQTAIAILQCKTATTGIARIALAAQLAGNVAQAATGLITDGACGQRSGKEKHYKESGFVHKAAKAFSGIIGIFTPIRRLP